jgi:hypothetical protein
MKYITALFLIVAAFFKTHFEDFLYYKVMGFMSRTGMIAFARPPSDFQTYGVSFTLANGTGLIAAGGLGSAILTIDAASDFVWYYSSFTAMNNAANTGWTEANRQYPPILVLMTPSDTSSQLSNQAVPITHIFGNGEMPFVLPAPRILPARTAITIAVQNLDTTIAYDLYLSLIGQRRYNN